MVGSHASNSVCNDYTGGVVNVPVYILIPSLCLPILTLKISPLIYHQYISLWKVFMGKLNFVFINDKGNNWHEEIEDALITKSEDLFMENSHLWENGSLSWTPQGKTKKKEN